jgi:hypothetical protein
MRKQGFIQGFNPNVAPTRAKVMCIKSVKQLMVYTDETKQ